MCTSVLLLHAAVSLLVAHLERQFSCTVFWKTSFLVRVGLKFQRIFIIHIVNIVIEKVENSLFWKSVEISRPSSCVLFSFSVHMK